MLGVKKMDKELHSALLNELTNNIGALKGHGTITVDNHVMSSNELIDESIHLLQQLKKVTGNENGTY